MGQSPYKMQISFATYANCSSLNTNKQTTTTKKETPKEKAIKDKERKSRRTMIGISNLEVIPLFHFCRFDRAMLASIFPTPEFSMISEWKLL